MKKIVLFLVVTSSAFAQIGRTFDWYTAAGDGLRDGFEHTDTKFTKADVKDFSLVVKDKLTAPGKGSNYLFPPVVYGTLVGYRGFKELAFVANATGDVWAIDVDLDRLYWQRHIDNLKTDKIKPGASCPGGVTSEPAMQPGMTFGVRRREKGQKTLGREDFFKKLFAPRGLYLLANDGNLYRLDTSTGKDMAPPVHVMPPGANIANLNAGENMLYAATGNSCSGVPNAVWQIDLSGDTPKVASFPSTAPEGFVGRNGVLIGSDDDVYAQTADALQILSPADLKVEQTFSGALSNVSPVGFNYKDRDFIVAAGRDSSLYLLDTKSVTAATFQTQPLPQPVTGLATWETTEGDRWVVAATSSSLVAFQFNDDSGKPVLKQAWTSQDLSLPETPVIANGVVFTVSAGERKGKDKLTGHAVLYGLDAETGKQIYSTGDQVTAPANRSGLTISNGRVYFTTTDSTLYGFGYKLEH